MVEAVEVHRTRNHAALLQNLLRDRAAASVSVLGLGSHGTSPAYYLETLAYAERHFKPQEAILCIYLGNDLTESSPHLHIWPPEKFLYRILDGDGDTNLDIHPQSRNVRDQFVAGLESGHDSLLVSLPATLSSHCMTIQVLANVRGAFSADRKHANEIAKKAALAPDEMSRNLERMGLNAKPFAKVPTAETQRTFRVLSAELLEAKRFCMDHGITLRIATIPMFAQGFYRSQTGREWSSEIGDYDILLPERQIELFAHAIMTSLCWLSAPI